MPCVSPRAQRNIRRGAVIAAALWLAASQTHAQRADENAVKSADDAFGTSVGNERIGLYSDFDARGFSPVAAGNIRLEGLYIDNPVGFTSRLVQGSTLRVGIAAQGYPFPAPTGISDYSLRRVGARDVVTLISTLGPFSTAALSIDTQQRVSEAFGFAGGVAYRRDDSLPGSAYDIYATGGVAHWRPTDRWLLQPFYARFDIHGFRPAPLVFTDGTRPPPASPARNMTPEWATGRTRRPIYGAVATFDATEAWTIKAGLFRVQNSADSSHSILLRDVALDGSANAFVAASRDQTFASDSGELRSTWTLAEGPRRHQAHAAVRFRATDRTYGGGAFAALGPIGLYEDASQLPAPAFNFGPLTYDEVRQMTVGLAYQGVWADRGEVRLGVQRADYRKTVRPPGRAEIISSDQPWLYDAALAVRLSSRLAVYAGYTVGLEESPVAPDNAVNRTEAPPALRTSQTDAGLRYALTPAVTVVAGVFEVRKPYFNVDPELVYRELGEVSHRGVELSLAGRPIAGLTVVAGAVLLEGEVAGEAVELGVIGPRPVGLTERRLLLNLDYQPPAHPAFSVDLGLSSTGDRAASGALQPALGGEQLILGGRTTVDLGGRWRFKAGRTRGVLRLQIQNLTDNTDWDVGSSGAFFVTSPRRAMATVTADF